MNTAQESHTLVPDSWHLTTWDYLVFFDVGMLLVWDTVKFVLGAVLSLCNVFPRCVSPVPEKRIREICEKRALCFAVMLI